jgi:Glycosyl hydrolase 36 superfamily, catalytic domain
VAATRREFLRGSLGLAVAGGLEASCAWPLDLDTTSAHGSEASYGSGTFGVWVEDEFSLPAYRYTVNQTTNPHAVTEGQQPGVLGPTEHVHQVGNDRVIALASNFGHVRLRQDEGCPKLLNDVDPETSQFGGGLGYLTDGEETLSTYYNGDQEAFERIFGVGYFRKRVAGNSYSVEQTISAPFGDDPVLISQATVTNHRDTAVTLRWIEYWGCQPYQFSYRSTIDSYAGLGSPVQIRRDLGRRFSHRVSVLAGNKGLLEFKRFEGRPAQEEAAWEKANAMLQANPYGFVTAVPELRPGTELESFDLPQTFLASLDAPAEEFSSNAGVFFGAGGPANPDGLQHPLDGNLDSSGTRTGLLVERTLHLGPKEERTMSFLYGYLPEGFSLEALTAKYESTAGSVLRQSSEQWKRSGMRFDVPAEPWIRRESTWNHYYLRSSQTFDDYFGEHILNQNGFYQYVMGFQGAARDPLQHCLPFLFSDPQIVRSVLRYTLKEVRDNGSIPYGIVGHGVIAPMQDDRASDLPLWLLWTASEYVLATRDEEFLEEQIPARFSATPGRTDSVRGLLERCYRHEIRDVGVGQHGVMRMLSDDWNDGLIFTWGQSDIKGCIDYGESVLNSAMAAWVFDEYARMLSYVDDGSDMAAQARASADLHRRAARTQWNGKWLRRAWLGPKIGWLGETTLWIEPQPWALLAGVTTPEQSRELVHTMDALLRQGPLGAAQMSDGPDMRATGSTSVGTLELGAIWPSLNQTLVWALAEIDPAMAWDEWKRNTLARHAASYPVLWYGIWSGNDSYNSTLSRQPGGTANEAFFHGTDFPILNLHSHACSLYSASKLLGIAFTEAGVNLRLTLPVETYRFDSPLLGVVKSEGRYSGWYDPARAGKWTVRIVLPKDAAIAKLEVNGAQMSIRRDETGAILASGSSSAHQPLRWTLS